MGSVRRGRLNVNSLQPINLDNGTSHHMDVNTVHEYVSECLFKRRRGGSGGLRGDV
jgi:hypothetical protein